MIVSFETADMDALIAHAVGLGVSAFAAPHPAGGGPNLSTAHGVAAADTWVFGTDAATNKTVSAPIMARKRPAADSTGGGGGSGEAVLDATFVALFKLVYGQLAAHLQARGWLDSARGIFVSPATGRFEAWTWTLSCDLSPCNAR